MKILKKMNLKEPIILIKILDNSNLVIVDASTTVRFVSKDSLEILDGFKAKIEHERYRASVVAFSNSANYFASITSDCKESRLYNTHTRKAIARMNRHHGEASCVGIDPKSRYMFSCGDDGKTFAIDIQSTKIAFTLPMHIDTINDIAFSDNGNWVATASYDRKVSIFHLEMMTPKHKLKHHSYPVMKLLFLNKHRILSADKNSRIIVTNYYTGKILYRLDNVHDDITQITKSADNKFLFVGTLLGYIVVYDLTTYQLLSKIYIKLTTSITALTFDKENNHLIIGTKEGDIKIYDIYEGLPYIKNFLQKGQYDKIEDFVKQNPILRYTEIYEMIEVIWKKTFEKAKVFLELDDKQKAVALFQPFKNIPSKNQIMKKTILEYAEFGKFTILVKENKFPLAYSLANTHKLYKDSKLYQAMEKKWKKAFLLARKYTMEPRGEDKVREILKPYRGVSEKTMLVQDLINKGEIYKRFRVSIGQKDFKLSSELIRQYPFLREFPEYDTLMNYADTLYIKSQELINKKDTHAAIKMLRILEDFDDFKIEVKELMQDIERREKFFNALQNEDLNSIYNLLAASEELEDTEEGHRYQEQWNHDLQKANEYAIEGDIDGIKRSIEKYMNISSRYMSLGTLFGWCYMTQLENSIKKKEPQYDIENGIKNYVLSFGLQNQIESFFHIFKDNYPETKLNLELLTKGSLSMWRPSMIVNSILE